MNEEQTQNHPPETASLPLRLLGVDYYGLLLVCALVGASMFFYVGLMLITDNGGEPENTLRAEETIEKKNDLFTTLSLESKAVFVWDVTNQKPLFAYNEESQLPLASLTKLMTALVTARHLTKDDVIIIEAESLKEEGDDGLLAHEEWTLRDLIDYTLVASSNDGADALASAVGGAEAVRGSNNGETSEEIFVEEMNALAGELGLTQTYFVNETGLDTTIQSSGSYGSARDMAKLLEYILRHNPTLTEATVYPSLTIESESKFIHTATNTNDTIGNIPGLIASKTGFTDLAGGNLVVAFDAGIAHPIIVSVLGSSMDGRFHDIEQLVHATLTYLTEE